MNREQLALEKYALQNLKESYEPTLEKIAAIKERYKKLQEDKLRQRISELGIELQGDEDKSALLEREKQFIFEKSQIENTLLPYTRSLRSMAFFVNKKYLSRNMSPLKVQDFSMEQGEIYLKWLEEEESSDEGTFTFYAFYQLVYNFSSVEIFSNKMFYFHISTCHHCYSTVSQN